MVELLQNDLLLRISEMRVPRHLVLLAWNLAQYLLINVSLSLHRRFCTNLLVI